ncbi:uncharacterized protein LOC127795237 isoform X2 [Diospyros lotus]|uniref:uncharacterized protein LOC127795237 isoform X2 n=1 Tax=Diospyros lotus TaxID=55363 RepID=UPI0022568D1E|nr:uncharacterized protein LOC127795237 isoform X2 [Diospyros lotus]
MAAMAIALRLRSKLTAAVRNRSFFVHFSSLSDSSVEDQNNTDTNTNTSSSAASPSQPQSSFSSYFSDVKASLKQQPSPHQQSRKTDSFSPSQAPSKGGPTSLEEIRKNLAEFRRRSEVPPPQQQRVSFQELYKRNVISKGEDSTDNKASQDGRLSFDAIRESLRQLRANNAKKKPENNDDLNLMSLSRFKEGLKLRPEAGDSMQPRLVIGGASDKLPASVSGKSEEGGKESPAMKTEFVKMYSYVELGEKLRTLRPEAKGGSLFSLGELNDRLIKLREMEEKEAESRIGGVSFKDLRDSLIKLRMSDDENAKKRTMQRLDVLSHLGGTPKYMLAPPKEHLVEKYFHPDNMSSSEKLKLELQKVREEFKMSESDCGSARVQVAQLTTKIKHLSTVLHKKDKHSIKGLQEMVQRRKKLLRYLRRTDWDSYSLVLSKLGLRDNPNYKH